MERHYILPMILAASLHVGLLFGFRTPHADVNPILTKHIRAEPENTPAIEVINRETATESDASTTEIPPTPRAPSVEPPPLPNQERLRMEIQREGFVDPTATVPTPYAGSFPPSNVFGDERGALSEVVSKAQLDAAPHVRFQAQPAYPFEAKRDGLRGEVLVDFIVDEAGRVMAPRVVRSSDRIFEEPTLRAVAKWRFEPGTSHGRVVRFHMSVPVVFNLSED